MKGGVVHNVVSVIPAPAFIGEPSYEVTDPIFERRFIIKESDIRYRVVDSYSVF